MSVSTIQSSGLYIVVATSLFNALLFVILALKLSYDLDDDDEHSSSVRVSHVHETTLSLVIRVVVRTLQTVADCSNIFQQLPPAQLIVGSRSH